jgi:hypothetical protein
VAIARRPGTAGSTSPAGVPQEGRGCRAGIGGGPRGLGPGGWPDDPTRREWPEVSRTRRVTYAIEPRWLPLLLRGCAQERRESLHSSRCTFGGCGRHHPFVAPTPRRLAGRKRFRGWATICSRETLPHSLTLQTEADRLPASLRRSRWLAVASFGLVLAFCVCSIVGLW